MPSSTRGGSGVSGMVSGTQVTLQGTAVGTPAYMAPEQGIDAATVDHRADIYSLGCSLFCMLTGHPPFEGSDVSEVMEQHATQAFPSLKQANARIPLALEKVVAKATAKRPSDRYASVSEMIEDLESYLGVRSDGSFSPSKQQADTWDSIATAYRGAAPRMRIARPLVWGWTATCALLTVAATMLHFELVDVGSIDVRRGVDGGVVAGGLRWHERLGVEASCMARFDVMG